MSWISIRQPKGYTLVELLIVLAIIGILVSLAVPSFQQSALKAKEAALKQNLFTMRAIIDQFYADRGQYPPTLESLIEKGYLRQLPVDPFTKSASTWEEIFEEQKEDEDSPPGVFDLRSGSDLTGLNGTPYNEW